MRIKKPQPFDPDRQYSPGKRAVYRGMVIIAERWVKPSDKLIEKVGKEEKTAIAGLLKQKNADASGKPQNDIPEEVKEVAGKLAKAFGARVEIHRIEIPEKKPRKEQGNETR